MFGNIDIPVMTIFLESKLLQTLTLKIGFDCLGDVSFIVPSKKAKTPGPGCSKPD